jgi:hypothetical protein
MRNRFVDPRQTVPSSPSFLLVPGVRYPLVALTRLVRLASATASSPNAWFRARVVVENPNVSVFVGDAKRPSLVITQLSERKRGLIGLWVGNNSAGEFAKLKIAAA